MREILFKNLVSVKNRRRVISVWEKSENKQTLTRVHKAFIYMITQEVDAITDLPEPVFFVVKHFNTKTKEEKFSFRVKGVFYIIKENGFAMVHFCHSLRIDIIPKLKAPVQP